MRALVSKMHLYFALYSDPTMSGWDLPVTGSGQNKKVGWSYGSQSFQPYGALSRYARPTVTYSVTYRIYIRCLGQ